MPASQAGGWRVVTIRISNSNYLVIYSIAMTKLLATFTMVDLPVRKRPRNYKNFDPETNNPLRCWSNCLPPRTRLMSIQMATTIARTLVKAGQ